LKLNCDKALFGLQWTPTLQFEETVELTVKWYKQYYKSLTQKNRDSMHEFTISQIEDYINLASERGIEWTK